MLETVGRGERIRTSGPCLPKTVLYQAELLPDRCQTRIAAGARQTRAYRRASVQWQVNFLPVGKRLRLPVCRFVLIRKGYASEGSEG